jgi:hypothetical protein
MIRTINTKINSISTLTNYFFNYADTFSFVLREDIEISEHLKTLISDLSSYLIDIKEVKEWPGTKLLIGKANLYIYHFNQESAFVLCRFNDNLYKWIHPESPEDLIFYKENLPVFISITHEEDAYFELDDNGFNFLTSKGLI